MVSHVFNVSLLILDYCERWLLAQSSREAISASASCLVKCQRFPLMTVSSVC